MMNEIIISEKKLSFAEEEKNLNGVKKFPTDVKILLPRYLQRNSNEIFIELDDP